MAIGFKLPLDAYVLMIPITYACIFGVTQMTRMAATDPETSNVAFYDDEKHAAQVAQRHDGFIRQFFDARIKSHRLGVFQNWFEGSPQ